MNHTSCILGSLGTVRTPFTAVIVRHTHQCDMLLRKYSPSAFYEATSVAPPPNFHSNGFVGSLFKSNFSRRYYAGSTSSQNELGNQARRTDLEIAGLLDADPVIRGRSAEALGRSRNLRGLNGLVKLLDDPDIFVRMCAITALGALGSLGDRGAIDPLTGLLHNSDVGIAVAAARALGDTGSWLAVEGLLAAEDHTPWDVRKAIAEALEDIRNANSIPGINDESECPPALDV